jgi:hypothetical protein
MAISGRASTVDARKMDEILGDWLTPAKKPRPGIESCRDNQFGGEA